MAGQPVGIFETQLRSDWVQHMIEVTKNNFGHEGVTWRRRALLAIPEAGLAGKTLTTLEMEDALIPLIGPAKDRPSRAAMVIIGCKEGIMEATGTWRRPEGSRRTLREYHIKGHMEMKDNGKMVSIVAGEL